MICRGLAAGLVLSLMVAASSRGLCRTMAAAADDAPMWGFRALDDDMGYLRMPTWAMDDSNCDWHAFLDQTFDTLVTRGARDLVVDLRGIEGGNDVGDVIVSHLATAPVQRQAMHRLARYRVALVAIAVGPRAILAIRAHAADLERAADHRDRPSGRLAGTP